MIYFFGDPHFGHANIINLCHRPFKDVEEMNRTLITNYNAVIQPDDEVIFTGDVAWKDVQRANSTMWQLNPSKKYLLIGNHDHKNINDPTFKRHFEWIKDYHELTYNGKLYVMSHYPFHSWRSSGRGSIMVHGHTHNNIDNTEYYRIDVGVDNPICSFAPISIERIESIMKNKKVEAKW